MPQGVQMFERHATASLVVHHHGAHRIARQLPADRSRRNIPFAQIGQHMNINDQPVRHHDQRFHVVLQEHLQVALKTIPLVMRVGKDRHIRRLIQRVFNPAHHRRAERIRNVEEHQPHRVAALTAEKPRHCIWPVAEFLRGFFDPFLCSGSDVPCQRRIIQNDRNGRRGKAAVFRDVPHRHHLILAACAFQG